tara:strand:- start:10821 stop:11084 length:264 start_codon:yes stop_codon:yes gene_type:complete
MQKRVNNIIKEVAAKYNLSAEVVKAITDSQFECARDNTKKGEADNPATFLNIRFKHLGLLVAKPSKINKIVNGRNARDGVNQDNPTD